MAKEMKIDVSIVAEKARAASEALNSINDKKESYKEKMLLLSLQYNGYSKECGVLRGCNLKIDRLLKQVIQEINEYLVKLYDYINKVQEADKEQAEEFKQKTEEIIESGKEKGQTKGTDKVPMGEIKAEERMPKTVPNSKPAKVSEGTPKTEPEKSPSVKEETGSGNTPETGNDPTPGTKTGTTPNTSPKLDTDLTKLDDLIASAGLFTLPGLGALPLAKNYSSNPMSGNSGMTIPSGGMGSGGGLNSGADSSQNPLGKGQGQCSGGGSPSGGNCGSGSGENQKNNDFEDKMNDRFDDVNDKIDQSQNDFNRKMEDANRREQEREQKDNDLAQKNMDELQTLRNKVDANKNNGYERRNNYDRGMGQSSNSNDTPTYVAPTGGGSGSTPSATPVMMPNTTPDSSSEHSYLDSYLGDHKSLEDELSSVKDKLDDLKQTSSTSDFLAKASKEQSPDLGSSLISNLGAKPPIMPETNITPPVSNNSNSGAKIALGAGILGAAGLGAYALYNNSKKNNQDDTTIEYSDEDSEKNKYFDDHVNY